MKTFIILLRLFPNETEIGHMLKCLWNIYRDGFSHLPRWGKMLMIIVVAKLFVLFFVFKFLLMPDYLNHRYTTDEEKSKHVLNELITKP